MTFNEAYEHYGKSYTKLAASLGVTENTIRNWKRDDKIPHMAQLAIQTLTDGKLKAD
jgi:uncharacterized protein YjcR